MIAIACKVWNILMAGAGYRRCRHCEGWFAGPVYACGNCGGPCHRGCSEIQICRQGLSKIR